MKEIEKFIVANSLSTKTIPNLVGDSHRYKNDRGEISLLHPCYASMELYEIFCINGYLFEDIERYDTLEEAEERIHSLLNSEQEAQASVARDDDSSTGDGKQKEFPNIPPRIVEGL